MWYSWGSCQYSIYKSCIQLPTVSFLDGFYNLDLLFLLILAMKTKSVRNEVLKVIDSQKTERYKIQYKTTYMSIQNVQNSNSLWQLYSNIRNSKDRICIFPRKHPQKLRAHIKLTKRLIRKRLMKMLKNRLYR